MTEGTEARSELLDALSRRAAEHAQGLEDADVVWLELAGRIVEQWEARWLRHDGRQPVAVAGRLDRKFRVCSPVAANALNHVQAALVARVTLPWVAASSARIAFEHALTGQWVLLTENGEDQLVGEISAKGYTRAREFADALDKLAAVDPAFAAHTLTESERQALLGDRPDPSGWAVPMLCDRFSDSRLFYGIYRDLSQAVHPSAGLLATYLTFAPDGMVRGVDARGRAAPSGELARALAVAALWALYVLEVCRDGQDHAADVREMGERAGLPVDLRASDQHPELQPTTAAY